MTQVVNDNIKNSVRDLYGKIAEGALKSCCNGESSSCGGLSLDAKARSMEIGYTNSEVNGVPDGSNLGLGCGNPGAIASIKIGETVLDLGSGAGFDCFLAAQQVGKDGTVIGVDMTSQMISKARSNAEQSTHKNVEFRLGEIEHLPVADNTVDVIISNCVINLSPEKAKVFQESFRVLKPGGRLAISDVVTTTELPQSLKDDMALYADCVSGASTIEAVKLMLKQAGFIHIVIKPKDESRAMMNKELDETQLESSVLSATIEANKPF
ncbi:Methylase involved in ubiquinone/menaquinone biosynthesis [Alteromonadaceae bacterium Bs31]|nr:Methylase involved in ubiquinone/menaquinone biosynthesis [Alteromonadaceae bacterium Bs31]